MKKNLFTLFVRWVFVLSFFLISSNVFGGKGGSCTPPTKPTLSTGSSVCNSGESFNFSVTNSESIDYKWGYTGGGSLINTTASTNTLSNVTSSGKISVQAGSDDCFSIGAQYIQAINIPTPDAGPNVEICSGLSATIGSNSLPDELTDVIAFQDDFGVPEFPGWAVHNSGGSGTWKHNLEGGSPLQPNTTTASNGYMFFDSDDESSSGTRYLTLPSIDLSAYTSVRFSMSHYYRRYESDEIAKLQVSINGGAFTDVKSWTSSTSNPENYSILVPSAVGQSDVMFRFEYKCNNDRYWFIDDIVISGTVPLTYTWDNGLGTGKTKTVNPTSTTTYNLTVSANGCSASDDVQVIVTNPSGDPSIFGDFVWNVYGYNGYDTDLSVNDYRGYYIQPDLGGGNLGVNTQSFWSDTRSPSFAGTTIDNGNLWNGCSVDDDYHTFTHKRKGFPCGNYTFTMNAWDDETRVIIDGVNIWSCDTWSGGTGSNSNGSTHGCETTNTFTVQLDADSEVEFHTFERTGGDRKSVDIVKSAPVALVGSASVTRTCRVRGNNWIDFYDENDELIASINPNGDDLGDVTMTSFVGSPMVMQDCDWPSNALYHTAYMGRRWIMTSDAYPNGIDFNNDVSVRLPYRVSELADLNNHAQIATPENPFDGGTTDPAATRSNLMLTKITGTTEDGVANLADCASTILGIPNSGSGVAIQSIANTEYVDFSIAQFSEFFLHKNHITSPLPVTLTSLSATCDNKVTLNWTTESEQNSDRFVIEKSRDGQTWTYVGEQSGAGNSNSTINYSHVDENTWSGISYYRLVQKDFNGDEEVYGPISAFCEESENNMIVYPNPNNGTFTIEISSDKIYTDAQLYLTDMTGKVISSQQVDVSNGTTQILFNNIDLQKGAYMLTLRGGGLQLKPVKVIVN